MNKIFLSIFLFFVFCLNANAQQIKSFTPDSLLYAEELKKFATNYLKEADKPLFEKFISSWLSGVFTWEEMKEIVDISNLLLKRYARPSPDFVGYFDFLLKVKNDSLGTSNARIPEWKKIFRFYLEKKDVPFKTAQQFLSLTLSLLNENILFESSSVKWKCTRSNFYFDFNQGSPVVRFDNIDLLCYAKRDSISILRTGGYLDPVELNWFGKKGLVTWERAGLSRDSVFAELSTYRISIRKTEYVADSVKFTYKKYFNTPLEGRLDEQVMSISNKVQALYPKFFSYQNKYILPDLFPGIQFMGGLSMQGSKLVGTGNEYEPATLEIFEKDTLRFLLKSRQVQITQNSISSPSVKMTLFIAEDSISHPDLAFSYQERLDLVRFTKSESYTSASPYSNSYHRINMSFDELSWNRKSRDIFLKPMTGSAQGSATFESENFFNYSFWEQLQGMDNIHPLVSLWEYSKGIGYDQFPVPNYANYLGIDAFQVRHQLMKLSRLGFIYYNDVSDIVRINRKMNYFLDASVGKTDYDVMYFGSRVQSPQENARLDLDNYDLHINGIRNMFLSDSQNVVLMPSENRIIMKRNRNFQFSGVIKAGLFTYYGSNFSFDYDTFKIDLQKIDSLRLEVWTDEKDNFGQLKIRGIDNLIEQVTGSILIDNPANKSGLKDYPEYPVFSSREYAYVFFDEKEIQNGVYKKKDVYFQVYPFTIDSLNNFSRQGIQMKGMFESGGIIPPMEQVLSLRNDYSLGFAYKTPETGIPVYNGAGSFYNDIELSNRGLRGAGKIEYLASTTYSDDFIFHPDSLMAVGREFSNEKQITGTPFPKVNSLNNDVLWLTRQDKFLVKMRDKPFNMFNDTVNLAGTILIQPSGMSGIGTIDLKIASISSDSLSFKSEQILADTADFKIKSIQGEILAFNAEDVSLKLDFDTRSANFRSNSSNTRIEFPENRYIGKVDIFTWDMNNEYLAMGSDKEIETGDSYDGLIGPRYISTLAKQDSLSFVSGLTFFDYRKSRIRAVRAPYIQVADARIYPNNQELTIDRNAVIHRLDSAEVEADYTSKYFKLVNASLDITGKNNYKGSADYYYIDETNRAQVIHFKNLSADTSRHTIGNGQITVLDTFQLSPFFEFQGDVRLSALKPYLTFDGGTRIVHDCKIPRSWLRFEAEINPGNIMIPVSDDPVDINQGKVFAGNLITRDSTHVYSAFLGPRKDYFDAYVTKADGFLTYDKMKRNYEISSVEKLKDKNLPGNYLRMNIDSCFLYGEGKVDLQVEFGQLKVNTVGRTLGNVETKAFQADVMMSLDFFFSDEALDIFSNELNTTQGLKAFNLNDPFYKLALRDFIGAKQAKVMESEMGLLGFYKEIPPEFKKKLVLSNIRLKWDQNSRSYIYHGPVGILRAGTSAVNKDVETYIQISKRSSGDFLDIYFRMSNSAWYYFSYNPGSFQSTSSNKAFNNLILELKDTSRKLKVPPGQTGYEYTLAPDRRAQLFLRNFMDIEDAEKTGR